MSLPLGVNAALTTAAGALGARLDPYLPFNFLVELDGLLVGGFSQVQGLECSIACEEKVEGGVNDYTHTLLKTVSHPRLVLRHGLTDLDGLWDWYDQTRQGRIRRRSGTIMVLDQQRLPAMWWDVKDALPVKWIGPSLEAGQDSQVAVESLELVHRGITKSALSSLTSAARLTMALAR